MVIRGNERGHTIKIITNFIKNRTRHEPSLEWLPKMAFHLIKNNGKTKRNNKKIIKKYSDHRYQSNMENLCKIKETIKQLFIDARNMFINAKFV